MTSSRHLPWPITWNTRDLGGLPLRSGGTTRQGSIVRGDNPDAMTAAGWSAAWEHGVRTVVDLREPGEDPPGDEPPPPGIRTVALPLDDHSDTGFWTTWGGGLDCTPLYYAAFLERFPARVVRVVRCVAGAPGGVLVHCSGGRDRTGLIVLVLLALAGVTRDAIVADHRESTARLDPYWRERGLGDQTEKIENLVAAHGTTIEESLATTVDGLDAEAYLRTHGLSADEIDAVRTRLVPGFGATT